ncbi:phosphoribosylaminoimidazolesuccinocarboxamide synthase [Maribacter ulvicola]|uniref:Phosphoribosylaminoimidazolesuccinocarboxamide synthase n=1 Tax=Maribacter ulvicola TaxID=228959 RepID=A0A1N6TKI2_9FLAO|nr:phosphoribosylaminoimidazolesuccinocarboxamide synthase [Maribacter ulvicola]SIQ53744.1 hypothetical protein SAMN05421797_1025 [Maribacter ulvicola]
MENEKIFRTKTGYCHILPDKILLSRDGIKGSVANVTVGKSITGILIIYGGLSAFLLFSAYNSFLKGQVPIAMVYAIVGLFLVYGIFKSLRNSTAPIIYRDKIKSVTFKKAIFAITRSRFEVVFEEEGAIKKRIIMLPGAMSNGQNETEKARAIMIEEQLLNE